MKIFVPGNLLLLGEYAVTLSGGRGLAVAVDIPLTITAERSDRPSFYCRYSLSETVWFPDDPPPRELSLVHSVLEVVNKPLLPFKITIDSSRFYHDDGRKKGFGSSAAVAAGLTYLLLSIPGSSPPDLSRKVFPLALEAHRNYQGGLGSGYDVAASLFGGSGLFTGGALPKWEPITLEWLQSLGLIYGEKAASTKDTLEKFRELLKTHPDKATGLLETSDNLVEAIAKTQGLTQASRIFEDAAAWNRSFHEMLEVVSEPPALQMKLAEFRKRGYAAKALGAGGEIAAVLGGVAEPLKISPSGILQKAV